MGKFYTHQRKLLKSEQIRALNKGLILDRFTSWDLLAVRVPDLDIHLGYPRMMIRKVNNSILRFLLGKFTCHRGHEIWVMLPTRKKIEKLSIKVQTLNKGLIMGKFICCERSQTWVNSLKNDD